MWHVTYTRVIGELRIKQEYVAGHIGAGTLIHALDKNLYSLCKSGYTFNRSRKRFKFSEADINCLRCLATLEREKRYSEDWHEETHAEFVANIPRE